MLSRHVLDVVEVYLYEDVNHTQKEYARGEAHVNRTGCLLAKPGRVSMYDGLTLLLIYKL
jgi:hypothetical protein